MFARGLRGGIFTEELVPVGGVAGEPGAFQAGHDPGPAEGDLGDQVLESFPVGGAGAGVALVDAMMVIWSAAQPRLTALPRRSYWRIADSVLCRTCLRLDWRTYSLN